MTAPKFLSFSPAPLSYSDQNTGAETRLLVMVRGMDKDGCPRWILDTGGSEVDGYGNDSLYSLVSIPDSATSARRPSAVSKIFLLRNKIFLTLGTASPQS